MTVVAADFIAHKAPSLREAVDDGVVVFAVCAGLQLLGHRYVSNAGEVMAGAASWTWRRAAARSASCSTPPARSRSTA